MNEKGPVFVGNSQNHKAGCKINIFSIVSAQSKYTSENTTWHKRSEESWKTYAATAKYPSINNKSVTIPCREWERPFLEISEAIHHRKSPIDIFFQIIERRICVRVFAWYSRLYLLTYPTQCVFVDDRRLITSTRKGYHRILIKWKAFKTFLRNKEYRWMFYMLEI